MFDIDILALDVGEKRIGIAFGNAKGKVVLHAQTFPRPQKVAEQFILNELHSKKINTLVVGLPYDHNGHETQQVKSIKQFISRIKKRHAVQIIYVDEWGSSLEAKQRLSMGSSPGKKLRETGAIDATAASIILETYFSSLT